MKSETSLYLDAVRFSAALWVFLEHLKQHARAHFDGFWGRHLPSISQTAVVVFFVLSGYVIAHVLATRERTLLEYTTSRAARLYSVAIPALILTAACNLFVGLMDPYADLVLGTQQVASTILSYVGTALFVSNFWLWPNIEPPNAPFWSLSIEAVYYVAIALFLFTGWRSRIISLSVLSLTAGPTVVLFAPVWLAGYLAYQLAQHRRLHQGAAFILWMGTTVLLLLCPLIEERFRVPLRFLRVPDRNLGMLLAAYAAGICFALGIFAFDAFSDKVEPVLRPLARVVRWLGSITFALYLFHSPLLTFFSFYEPALPPSLRMPLLIGGTLLVVGTLGRLCEQSKSAYKKRFLAMWLRVRTN